MSIKLNKVKDKTNKKLGTLMASIAEFISIRKGCKLKKGLQTLKGRHINSF